MRGFSKKRRHVSRVNCSSASQTTTQHDLENEELYFMDAVYPKFQSKSVCGWIKKGEIKTLPTTSTQYRMHFVGAIELKKMAVFAREYETVDANGSYHAKKYIVRLETHFKR